MLKRSIYFAFTLLSLALVYFLFEPVFLWNFSWQKLPAQEIAQQVESPKNNQWQSAVDAGFLALKKAQSQTGAPALSVAVGVDGELVWANAIGYRDLETLQRADTDTAFRIGSSSKAITSSAVGVLLKDGVVDLDLPIQHYVPNFPVKAQPISTRQVMSHTAGFRNYQWCACAPVWEVLNQKNYANVQESLSVFADDSLLFAPGTSFAYTSFGYNLTGAVIEGASGISFNEYLQRAVLVPLHMQNTALEETNHGLSKIARFYEVKGAEYKLAYSVNNSNKWPSGGMLSTPSDMVKLGMAVLANEFLPAEVKEELFKVQTLSNGEPNPQNYALGWRHSSQWPILNNARKMTVFHHGGLAQGSSSVFMLYPEFGLSLSLMMNKGTDQYQEILVHANAIADVFIEAQLRRQENVVNKTAI